MDRRSKARQLVMQIACMLDTQKNDGFEMLTPFLKENCDDEMIRKMAGDWAKGLWRNEKQCDELIAEAAVKWDIARLNMVDRCILRLGTYQLKFCHDIPAKVVINEAIELAKTFSTESSPAFVNGVLDAIYRKLKSQQNQDDNA